MWRGAKTGSHILAAGLVLAGCGPAATVGREPVPQEARGDERSGELPPLSEGACGGLAALELGAAVSVLHDRVRIPTLDGAAAPHWERGWTGTYRTLRREVEGRALTAEASELYRSAPEGDLAAAVALVPDNEDARVVALDAREGGAQVIAFLPAQGAEQEDEEGERGERLVPLLDAYVTTADRSLVRVRFQVSPEAHAEGGCERLAVRMAEATTRGAKSLAADAGEHALFGGLAVTVPASTVIEHENMGHWVEHHVHVLIPLGEERTPFMMIRLDSHPGRPDVSVPTTMVTAPVFGRSAEWRTWVSESGFRWRDVIVPGGPAGNVWVAIGAETPETVAQLGAIAASLGERAVDRALPSCASVPSPPPAPELSLSPSSAGASALRTLLSAREVQTSADRTLSPQPGAAFGAMRTLFRLPAADGAAAFRRLVERGTAAGRVYGLIGLHYLAASDFDAIACASREALSTTIPVADRCGVRSVAGGELLEASGPSTAFTVQDSGPLDLRGAGLVRRIQTQIFEESGAALTGEGWVPPLEPGGAAPPALAPADPDAPRPITMSGYQLRWTTRDGRVAETYGREAARHVDAWLRFPSDEAITREVRCVLDARGRRACGGPAVAEALAEREHECGIAAPSAVPYRIFDDGPWAELVVANGVCGIRAEERSLHCFKASEYQRTWGAIPAAGLFGAFRMPIDGRVIGVSEGEIHSQPAFYAWTEDGALYQWDLNEPARVIHRFDSPVESVASAERVDFARLRDGRVFARGLRSVDEWWDRGRPQDGSSAFEEVEALRGAHIVAASRGACVLDAERRVRCWGYFMEGTFGPEHEVDGYGPPPIEIAAYRGATELLLDRSWSCARIGGMQLLCAMEDIERRLPGRMRDGYLSLDLDRLRPQDPPSRD